ncbi:uncharacterized protein LOC144340118 [Macaca mulatta]
MRHHQQAGAGAGIARARILRSPERRGRRFRGCGACRCCRWRPGAAHAGTPEGPRGREVGGSGVPARPRGFSPSLPLRLPSSGLDCLTLPPSWLSSPVSLERSHKPPARRRSSGPPDPTGPSPARLATPLREIVHLWQPWCGAREEMLWAESPGGISAWE